MPGLRRRYYELHLLAQDPVLLAGLLVVGAFTLTFVIWPLGRVIVQGCFTAEGQFSLAQFQRYGDPRYTHYYHRIFYDTVRMGLLSASYGTALGLLFAYTAVHGRVPGKSLVHLLAPYRPSRCHLPSRWQRSCCLAVTAWWPDASSPSVVHAHLEGGLEVEPWLIIWADMALGAG